MHDQQRGGTQESGEQILRCAESCIEFFATTYFGEMKKCIFSDCVPDPEGVSLAAEPRSYHSVGNLGALHGLLEKALPVLLRGHSHLLDAHLAGPRWWKDACYVRRPWNDPSSLTK
jgi:hypothetical protein